MNNDKQNLEILQNKLIGLNKKLNHSYYSLGKRTQEFVETQSHDINKIVDEIIITKKEIEKIKQTIKKGNEYDKEYETLD